MYYFYIILSVGGRVGFGICEDPKDRNKKYASHSGDIVQFVYLFGGVRAHAKSLERTIKNDWAEQTWVVDDWKTEWLEKTVSVDELYKYVTQILTERPFLKLELVAKDYNFQQGDLK